MLTQLQFGFQVAYLQSRGAQLLRDLIVLEGFASSVLGLAAASGVGLQHTSQDVLQVRVWLYPSVCNITPAKFDAHLKKHDGVIGAVDRHFRPINHFGDILVCVEDSVRQLLDAHILGL